MHSLENNLMTQDQIIQQIKSGNREKAFLKFYDYFPAIKSLVLKSGGSEEDASDIFQEALIVLYRKVQKDDFKISSSVETYLYGICRFMCYAQNRASAKEADWKLSIEPSEEDEIAELLQQEEKFQLAETALKAIGEKCVEVLQMFYYQGIKMVEIAKNMGFSSAKIAKNQKYKCLERAKKKFVELKNESN